MKKIRLFLLLLLMTGPSVVSYACEVCKERQPAGWEGISHGEGPRGNADLVIIWGAVVLVGITLFLSVKYLVKPQESDANHIKNRILWKITE
ncbi:MAG: hypothetical protein KF870_05185 [Leadbetterella sp.]|nr:hypothetical protein [Leadbetterella sp.]